MPKIVKLDADRSMKGQRTRFRSDKDLLLHVRYHDFLSCSMRFPSQVSNGCHPAQIRCADGPFLLLAENIVWLERNDDLRQEKQNQPC